MGGPGSRLSTAHELLWRVALLVVSLGGGISGGSLDPGSLVSIISTSTCSSFAYSANVISFCVANKCFSLSIIQRWASVPFKGARSRSRSFKKYGTAFPFTFHIFKRNALPFPFLVPFSLIFKLPYILLKYQ